MMDAQLICLQRPRSFAFVRLVCLSGGSSRMSPPIALHPKPSASKAEVFFMGFNTLLGQRVEALEKTSAFEADGFG